MCILTALTTSSWLKSLIESNKHTYNGTILAIFSSSILLNFENIGLVHLAVNEDNLSPFSIAFRNIYWENINPNSNISLINNVFYINEKLFVVNNKTKTFDESLINPIEKIILPDLKTIDPYAFYKNEFVKLKEDLIASIFNNNNFTNIIKSMIGLGEGLTPSGDDYIIGFIFGLYVLKRTDIINFMRDSILLNLEKQTNIISKTFIHHAFEGRFSNSIVSQNWDALTKFGHKSGYFVMQGLYDSINAYNLAKCTI